MSAPLYSTGQPVMVKSTMNGPWYRAIVASVEEDHIMFWTHDEVVRMKGWLVSVWLPTGHLVRYFEESGLLKHCPPDQFDVPL